jgi:hypothetical protein
MTSTKQSSQGHSSQDSKNRQIQEDTFKSPPRTLKRNTSLVELWYFIDGSEPDRNRTYWILLVTVSGNNLLAAQTSPSAAWTSRIHLDGCMHICMLDEFSHVETRLRAEAGHLKSSETTSSSSSALLPHGGFLHSLDRWTSWNMGLCMSRRLELGLG